MMYICIYIYIHMYTDALTRTCVYVDVYIYVYMYVCVYVYMYMYMYLYMFVSCVDISEYMIQHAQEHLQCTCIWFTGVLPQTSPVELRPRGGAAIALPSRGAGVRLAVVGFVPGSCTLQGLQL